MTAFLKYDGVVIEQHEHYQKGGLRNRCFIASSNGMHRLTIPLLKGKHQQLPVRDVRVDDREPWVKVHRHALMSAYRNAPFYDEYADVLMPILEKKHSFLFDLNLELLHSLLTLSGLSAALSLSSSYQRDLPDDLADYRHAFAVKITSEEALPFFHPEPYPQVFQEKHLFLPNLSILDLLFCQGPEAYYILRRSTGM